VLFGDGKNVSAMYKAVDGARNVHPVTGEITPRRHDPDARKYQTNGGATARGIPWVDLDCRQPGIRNERLILDFEAVALGSDEMTVGMDLVERTLTVLPETQVLVWDGAMKGVHMRRLIADHGVIPMNHATEKPKGDWRKIGPQTFRRLDGTDEERDLYLIRGAPTIQVTVRGEAEYARLVRTKTSIRERANRYWVTNDYVLPDHPAVPRSLRGATTSIRLDTTEEADRQRKWGLNENLRVIDYMDDDFPLIYGLRNSAENQNRILEDTLWAGRAHSVGIPSGRIDHLGFALYINLIARIAYEQRTGTAPVAWLERPARFSIAA
jgi:hypothetical protein